MKTPIDPHEAFLQITETTGAQDGHRYNSWEVTDGKYGKTILESPNMWLCEEDAKQDVIGFLVASVLNLQAEVDRLKEKEAQRP